VTLAAPAPDDLLVGIEAVEVARDATGRVLDLALAAPEAVGAALHAITARVAVVDVRSGTPSLRQVYLRAVGVDPEADAADATGAEAPS
jgi:hypothetical protein